MAGIVDQDQEVLSLDRGATVPWRPIHYLGSKLRVLETLEDAVGSVSSSGDSVCDLFSGSGTVSAWLARSRPVTAVDIQEYSRVICGALLKPQRICIHALEEELREAINLSRQAGTLFAATPMIELEQSSLVEASNGSPENFARLIEAGSLMTAHFDDPANDVQKAMAETWYRVRSTHNEQYVNSMVLRHFGGVYFSYCQAAELDAILEIAHRQTGTARDTMIAAILVAASELVNTVGKQFAQPLRPRDKGGRIKKTLYSQAARDRYKSPSDAFVAALKKLSLSQVLDLEHRAIRSDYSDYLTSPDFNESVVYADPPYTRDHYSRFYHVLETLALRDDPPISTNTAHGRTTPSRGVYRVNRHQSPFCIRSQAPSAFATLFSKVSSKGSSLVLSYSPYSSEKNAHPRVMTLDQIRAIATSYFTSVEVESVGEFFHSRLNRTDLNKEVSFDAEYLFVCR